MRRNSIKKGICQSNNHLLHQWVSPVEAPFCPASVKSTKRMLVDCTVLYFRNVLNIGPSKSSLPLPVFHADTRQRAGLLPHIKLLLRGRHTASIANLWRPFPQQQLSPLSCTQGPSPCRQLSSHTPPYFCWMRFKLLTLGSWWQWKSLATECSPKYLLCFDRVVAW